MRARIAETWLRLHFPDGRTLDVPTEPPSHEEVNGCGGADRFYTVCRVAVDVPTLDAALRNGSKQVLP